ncbi:hypothetical protein ACHHYP_16146 [Achlya hypogyna]|uniref:SWIM-type domain-containing protein n=1 Tax=Achlya hypogyna TaxID=1202772 RepID=A0A1V9Y9H3_ACHHY|nr:hypothetical protein ACHHYP_16146 [Achlya hypogyna]
MKDKALAEDKTVRVTVSSGSTKRYECKCSECPYYVLFCRRQTRGVPLHQQPWYISSFNDRHLNCTSSRTPTAAQIAALPSVRTAVGTNPSIKAREIVGEAQGNDNINLDNCLCKLYRAPSSRNLRIMGIDGAHSLHPIFDGKQLLLVGRDADFCNVTLGIALIENESRDDNNWFWSYVQASGLRWDVPVLCDRSAGLIAAANDLFPCLFFCTVHIVRNLKANFKGFRAWDEGCIWALQATTTKEDYDTRLIGWALYPYVATTPLYGWRSTNFVESENASGKALGHRAKNPYEYFNGMCADMATDAYERHKLAVKWDEEGLKITPKAWARMEAEKEQASAFAARPTSENIVVVTAKGQLTTGSWKVNTADHTCTCTFMAQYGIPCRHYCSALLKIGSFEQTFNGFHQEYQVASYYDAYSGQSIVLPVDINITSDPTLLPATCTKKNGRGVKATKRKKSRGENA